MMNKIAEFLSKVMGWLTAAGNFIMRLIPVFKRDK